MSSDKIESVQVPDSSPSLLDAEDDLEENPLLILARAAEQSQSYTPAQSKNNPAVEFSHPQFHAPPYLSEKKKAQDDPEENPPLLPASAAHQSSDPVVQKSAVRSIAYSHQPLNFNHLTRDFRLYRSKEDNPNDPASKNNLGLCYQYGLGVEKDFAKAKHYYKLAAAKGHADAQNNLGLCYLTGWGKERDVDLNEATHWFKSAAEKCHSGAQNNLSNCRLNGIGVSKKNSKKNETRAINGWILAARWGDANALFNLYGRYQKIKGKNKLKALHLLAKNGYTDVQHYLGNLYLHGDGVLKDAKEATRLFGLAAEKGHLDAQYAIAWCHAEGIGVEKDMRAAFKLFSLLAGKKHPPGEYSLGRCYCYGIGVPKDVERAVALLEPLKTNSGKTLSESEIRDINKDLIVCYNELGVVYRDGSGGKKDSKLAANYFKKGADLNDAKARYLLSRCYDSGDGASSFSSSTTSAFFPPLPSSASKKRKSPVDVSGKPSLKNSKQKITERGIAQEQAMIPNP